MKQCPACGSSYTDDTLVYCLQDGAALRQSSQQANPLSMVATLRDDARTDEETVSSINSSSAPTVEIPASALPTTPHQEARTTAGDNSSSAPQPSNNTARVIVTTALVTVLLLAAGGLGAWMIFRGGGPGRGGRAAEANSNSVLAPGSPAAANREASAQANNQARDEDRPDKGGRWFVVMASYPKDDSNSANARLEMLRRQGFDARLVSSDDYPNFKSGLWLVVMGPYTRNRAEELLEQVRPKVKDAYTKSGW